MKTALIVDDNTNNLYFLELLFKGYGFQVVSAPNGAEALALARENPPTLIVSDILMPVMDGWTLCQTWRADPLLRHIPFVFYTATYTEAKDEELALKLGADRFVTKPQEPEILMAIINDVLTRAAEGTALGHEINTELRTEYSEALFRKLQKKVADLEQANQKLAITIVQLRRAKDKLLLLDAAVRAAPIAIIITDAQGNIVWVNSAFSHDTGYSYEEVIGRNPRLLKSGRQTADYYAEMWRTITAGKFWHGEFVNRREDGRLYTAESIVAPVRDPEGTISHFVAIQVDVTVRKENEQHIREQAELLDKAADAIVVFDLDRHISFWNSSAERLFGWPAHEALGQTAEACMAAANTKATKTLSEAIATGQDWHGELHTNNRKGTPLILSTSITPIRDAQGHPTGFISISTDITEKKHLEEQLLHTQRIESIGMLAAGIAHDLNNMLTPVLMAVPLLREHATEPVDLSMLATVESSAKQGAGLVQQILGFARGIGGEPQLVQTRHILRDIASLVTQTFPKNITLEQQFADGLWPVKAIPTQLHQVLLNLCINARDAMPDGGTLRLRAENCTVDASTTGLPEGVHPGDWLKLVVEDTGTGIPPELLGRIWEPFFTTKAPGKGTGLGLPTVRGIVETHHGAITVHTAVNAGTTFTIYLPAAEPLDTDDTEQSAPVTKACGHGELILLVDDEKRIRDTTSFILTRLGYQVLTAQDGIAAAIAFVPRATEIALVITDLDMPNAGGAPLVETIRHLSPGTKIIVMTGTAPGLSPDLQQANIRFLPKPCSAETLKKAVQQLIPEPTHARPTASR